MRALLIGFSIVITLVLTGTAHAGTDVAFYSVQGDLSAGTDVVQLIFDTEEVTPADPMQFSTFHNAGGTNVAGDVIAGDGFDPTLGFKERGGLNFTASDDNDGPGNDALIPREELGSPNAGEAIAAGTYELYLAAAGASLGGLAPSWAVDLIGPASSDTRISDIVLVGNPTISSLKYGTTASGLLDLANLSLANGNSLTITGELNVATTGVAKLSISAGANLSVGSLIGGAGAVINHDDGTLTVNGGTFSPGVADYAIDGDDAADLPTLKLTNGATATFGGFFDVGNFQRGRLEVLSGSNLTVDTLSAGFDNNSDGDILISGAGSEISATTSQTIGFIGKGNVEVLNGAKLTSVTDAEIAVGVGAAGSGVVVRGPGSLWEIMLDLTIGDSDRGMVSVEDGALVTVDGDAFIAFFSGASNSIATVTGDDSQMNITGDLFVGDEDVGIVTITSGGRVTSADAFLGRYDAAASGIVNVTGTGNNAESTWQAADIFIGGDGFSPQGNGQLNISDDGAVTAANVTIWNTGGVELDNGKLSVTTLESDGNFTGAGTATVASGGAFTNRGTVAPGLSTATLNIAGDFVQESAGSLDIEIDGTGGSGVGHDMLAVTGVATLGGRINLILGNYVPDYADEFVVLTYSSRIGQFQPVTGAFVDNTKTLAPIYGSGELKLVAALPSDSNLDGIVNFDDFVIVSNNFNQTGTEWVSGDFNLDSQTNFDDFVVLSNNFGMMVFSGRTVPEPTTFLLFAIASGLSVRGRWTSLRVDDDSILS